MLKSDAYHVKKRRWQLVRTPRLRPLAFIAREPCREKEGISIKKIPFTPNSKHRISIHRPLFHLIHILIFFPIRIHLGINRDGQ